MADQSKDDDQTKEEFCVKTSQATGDDSGFQKAHDECA